MSNNNKKKAEQLGMPLGTASGRLKKQLLFKYVQLAGDDHCYACSDRIESVDDFTVEHIIPWLDSDPELFWDLDNVAFSHKACNIPHRFQDGTKLRKIGPEGTAWCSVHEEFLPIEEFWSNKSRWNGLHSTCKTCFDRDHRIQRNPSPPAYE